MNLHFIVTIQVLPELFCLNARAQVKLKNEKYLFDIIIVIHNYVMSAFKL